MITRHSGGVRGRVLQAARLSFAASAALLAACGGGSSGHSSTSPAARSLHGTVYGGRQPVAGSTVTVYSAGLPGAGLQISTQIGQTTSDANGDWNVATLSPAPATGQLVYVVATGGDAGGGTNNSIALMTLAGLSPNFPAALNVDELTTVAATSVLQHQITLPLCSTIAGNTIASGRCVEIAGLPTGTATNNSLSRRAGTLGNLVDPATGQAATFLTNAASSSPLKLTLQKLDTLADLLANCVNSAGAGDGSACGSLFSSTASSNTLAAALNMASAPAVNTDGKGLLGLLKPPLVYSPVVSAAPASWTVGGQPFTYVMNEDSTATCNLSGFSIDPASGSLTQVSGSPLGFGVGPAPGGSPNGRFVYVGEVTASAAAAIAAFAVDPATGTLTPVSGSPFATAGSVEQVVVTPSGKFAYATVGSDADPGVLAYSIDADSGVLTLVGGPYPASVTGSGYSLGLSPNGQFVYVLNYNDANISAFSIDPASGTLTSLGAAIPSGNAPIGLAFTPDSAYAYVDNGGFGSAIGSISAYAFNATTGALAPVTTGGAVSCGSPVDPHNCFSVNATAGYRAEGVAVDGSGKYLYTGTGSNSVVGFRIDPATGALTLLPASPFASGNNSLAVGTDSSGRFLYALDHDDNTISAYTIDAASGALTPITGSPYASGAVGPQRLTVGP